MQSVAIAICTVSALAIFVLTLAAKVAAMLPVLPA